MADCIGHGATAHTRERHCAQTQTTAASMQAAEPGTPPGGQKDAQSRIAQAALWLSLCKGQRTRSCSQELPVWTMKVSAMAN